MCIDRMYSTTLVLHLDSNSQMYCNKYDEDSAFVFLNTVTQKYS